MCAVYALTYDNLAGKFFSQLIGSAQLAAAAVTSGKLGALAVNTADINWGAITSGKLASGFPLNNLLFGIQSFTNLLENGSFEVGNPPTGWNAVRSVLARVTSPTPKIGSYALSITSDDYWAYARQFIADYMRYSSRAVTLGAWCYAPSGNDKVQLLAVADGVATTPSGIVPKDDAWHWITVTHPVSAIPQAIQAIAYVNFSGTVDTDDILYVDGIILVEGDSCPAFSPKPLDYQSVISGYIAPSAVGDGHIVDLAATKLTGYLPFARLSGLPFGNLYTQIQSFTNLLFNGDFEVGDPPTGWTAQSSILARESTIVKHGPYSMKITSQGAYGRADQYLANPTYYPGRKISAGVWCYALSTNDKDQRFTIEDSIAGRIAISPAVPKDNAWHWITASGTVSPAVTWVIFRLFANDSATSDIDDVLYADGAILVEGDSCPAFAPKPLDYQSVISGYLGALAINTPDINWGAITSGKLASGFPLNNLLFEAQSFVNLLSNGDFEVGDPPTGWFALYNGTISRTIEQVKLNTYSLKMSQTGGSMEALQYLDTLIDFNHLKGRKITLGVWCYGVNTNSGNFRVGFYDGVGEGYSDLIPQDNSWRWTTVTFTVNVNATQLRVIAVRTFAANGNVNYIDGAVLVEGDVCPAFSPKPLDYQSVISGHIGSGQIATPHIQPLGILDASIASGITAAKLLSGYMGLDGTSGYVLTARGAGVTPAYAMGTKVSSGTFTGNDTEARAIAHGLGVTPKIVFIVGGVYFFRIITGLTNIFYISAAASGATPGIAVPDATSFYVGEATSYAYSANAIGTTYYWVAIG